ncbi:hypothetical protein evm_011399 [Chilo suppressalis]|nr:hypothetical protein evm_011399 [Chilo suppressalis]
MSNAPITRAIVYRDPINWVCATPSTAENFSNQAFVAGKEGWDGSPLWIIRSHHKGELCLGKLAIKHRASLIPHAGQEIQVENFEILLAQPSSVHWVPSRNGQVPIRAIHAGNSYDGEPFYIARVGHRGSLTPGKVHPSHQCCYIPFGGSALSFREYEVLCKVD